MERRGKEWKGRGGISRNSCRGHPSHLYRLHNELETQEMREREFLERTEGGWATVCESGRLTSSLTVQESGKVSLFKILQTAFTARAITVSLERVSQWVRRGQRRSFKHPVYHSKRVD